MAGEGAAMCKSVSGAAKPIPTNPALVTWTWEPTCSKFPGADTPIPTLPSALTINALVSTANASPVPAWLIAKAVFPVVEVCVTWAVAVR